MELNRDVAFKEIKPEYAHHQPSQARFLREAEVTADLEHPGVVPVHGQGRDADGRPYYAMRFIKGDSLKVAIAAFHDDKVLQGDCTRRESGLRNLLRRFLSVCYAVAYAHSRGVIHRDLKPDNVMLGPFDETLVVDWGLAKVFGRSADDGLGPCPESTLPNTSDRPAETLPGSVLGTPSYMSPEQAEGDVDRIGPRSDVYSLGATLYHLLTGRPPFTGTDRVEIFRRIKCGEFRRPRESSPWIDPALEAIALKAMATRPEDRYPSPQALAEDIEKWSDGALVSAWREPWSRKARRWKRRHRLKLAIASTGMLVAALLVGAFVWQGFSHRQRTDLAALADLERSEQLVDRARKIGAPALWEQAIAEARRAADRLESGGGSPSLRSLAAARLEALRREVRTVAYLEEARIRAAYPGKGTPFDAQSTLDAYQAAFRNFGIDVATLTPGEAAKRIRSSRIADDLIAALDDWASHKSANLPPERLREIARLAEIDPGRAEVREAVARGDSKALRELCRTPEARRSLGRNVRSAFAALARRGSVENLPLLEAIRRENPGDFWLNNDAGVANFYATPPRPAEAARCLAAAVSLRPNSPGARVNLGNALDASGDADGAIAEFHEAIRMEPNLAEAHYNLGVTLRTKGRTAEAIAALTEAIRLDPRRVDAHINLGNALDDGGDGDGALREFHEAIRIDPNRPDALNNLGVLLRKRGDLDGAIVEFEKAIAIDPRLANPRRNLGKALESKGRIDAAIAEFREAIRLEPGHPGDHFEIGRILLLRGDEAAIAELREAVRLGPGLSLAHNNLGIALNARGDVDAAIAEYHEAIRLTPDDASFHNNLGLALRDKGGVDAAIAEYHEAIRLRPDFPEAHTNLGAALQAKGKVDDAIAELREAIRIKPDYRDAHFRLGIALHARGDDDDAIAEFREAIRIKPDAAAHYNLGNVLLAGKDEDGAIGEFRRAILSNPDHPEARCNLGVLLRARGKFAEALTHLERGHEVGSKRPNWRVPSARFAADCRRIVELEAKLPEYLKGEVKPKDADERALLAELCRCRSLHAASARFWSEAFADRPSMAAAPATGRRYAAACSASLAGTGRSEDDPAPDDSTRAGLRKQALGWLRQDLEAWSRLLERGKTLAHPAILKAMDRWKSDADLASIRDEPDLAKFPEAERDALRSLWADVDSLRKKAGGP